jgi:uncharacterized protein (DUF488 family)
MTNFVISQRGQTMMGHMFTFGYEGLSLQLFIGRLKAEGVQTVVDVRANPLSRKPGFSKRAFAAALNAEEIGYFHTPTLGCPKAVRDRYKQDGDWTAYTRGFLAYLRSQPEALAALAGSATLSLSCLVCFEADFNRCHRTYVADAVAMLSGLAVMHLTDQTAISGEVVRSAA